MFELIENVSAEQQASADAIECVLSAAEQVKAQLSTDTIESGGMEGQVDEAAPCLCQSYLRATEHAAIRAARWLGRADQEAAEESAAPGCGSPSTCCRSAAGSFSARRRRLSRSGRLGAGGIDVDLALDPLEGRGVVARGGTARCR